MKVTLTAALGSDCPAPALLLEPETPHERLLVKVLEHALANGHDLRLHDVVYLSGTLNSFKIGPVAKGG